MMSLYNKLLSMYFFFLYAWNQGGIVIIVSISLLQFCSAKTQEIWKNEWLQLLFYNRKG